MSKYCWNCANIGKCRHASGKITHCKYFNPYLSVTEFCAELGISVHSFFDRTRKGRSIAGLQKDARKKGIVILKDYHDKKKHYKWVIYKVKMK